MRPKMATPKTDKQKTVIPLRWVKLSCYCASTGDTADAVHTKRKRGTWKDGTHCKVAPDGNLWVNTEEVYKWIEEFDSVKVA